MTTLLQLDPETGHEWKNEAARIDLSRRFGKTPSSAEQFQRMVRSANDQDPSQKWQTTIEREYACAPRPKELRRLRDRDIEHRRC